MAQRHVPQCGYAESKKNVLRRILNVLTDGAVRQFSGREFQSLGAATEKRRAAVSKLCGGTDRSFCVNDRSKWDWNKVMNRKTICDCLLGTVVDQGG